MVEVADLVAEMNRLVDSLASMDVAALDPAELQLLVVAAQQHHSKVVAASSQATQRWQQRGAWKSDGTLSAALALGREARRDHRSTKFELRRATFLQKASLTRAAVLEGKLSLDHVDLFMRCATDARMAWFLEHEAELIDGCVRLPLFDDARRLMQYWMHRVDDEIGAGRERPAPSTLYLSRHGENGEAELSGRLSAIDTEIVEAELRRLANDIKLEDRKVGDERTPAQRRAAALVRMAARSKNATGMTARPLFQVLVGDETARRLCQLASGHVVHPDDLADHIDNTVMETFLFDGPSVVVATSKRRTFTGALRKAIQVRDRRCQHASGCPTSAIDGDVDHRTPAARGGPTSQWNGRATCVAHNRFADLRDEPEESAERVIDILDAIRCRIRWSYLRDLHDRDLHDRDLHDSHADDDVAEHG